MTKGAFPEGVGGNSHNKRGAALPALPAHIWARAGDAENRIVVVIFCCVFWNAN